MTSGYSVLLLKIYTMKYSFLVCILSPDYSYTTANTFPKGDAKH